MLCFAVSESAAATASSCAGMLSSVGVKHFTAEDNSDASQTHRGERSAERVQAGGPVRVGKLRSIRTPHLLADGSLLQHPHQVAAQPLLQHLQEGTHKSRQCILTLNDLRLHLRLSLTTCPFSTHPMAEFTPRAGQSREAGECSIVGAPV